MRSVLLWAALRLGNGDPGLVRDYGMLFKRAQP